MMFVGGAQVYVDVKRKPKVPCRPFEVHLFLYMPA